MSIEEISRRLAAYTNDTAFHKNNHLNGDYSLFITLRQKETPPTNYNLKRHFNETCQRDMTVLDDLVTIASMNLVNLEKYLRPSNSYNSLLDEIFKKISKSDFMHLLNNIDVFESHYINQALKKVNKILDMPFSFDYSDRDREVTKNNTKTLSKYCSIIGDNENVTLQDFLNESSGYNDRDGKDNPFIQTLKIKVSAKDAIKIKDMSKFVNLHKKFREILGEKAKKMNVSKNCDDTHSKRHYYLIANVSFYSHSVTVKEICLESCISYTYCATCYGLLNPGKGHREHRREMFEMLKSFVDAFQVQRRKIKTNTTDDKELILSMKKSLLDGADHFQVTIQTIFDPFVQRNECRVIDCPKHLLKKAHLIIDLKIIDTPWSLSTWEFTYITMLYDFYLIFHHYITEVKGKTVAKPIVKETREPSNESMSDESSENDVELTLKENSEDGGFNSDDSSTSVGM